MQLEVDASVLERQTHSLIEAAARRSYGKLVAFLAARTRDVAAAEDALSEAFAAALQDWPAHGCPANPEAWLLTVARRRSIDSIRRRRKSESVVEEWRLLIDQLDSGLHGGEVPDERLGLLFACAHPAIDPALRAPLMLQVVLGLEAATIASAFLVSPVAMSQRLVRAKNKIRRAGIPFRVPAQDELAPRLADVLDAIYAAFAEGWIDPAGTDPARRDLAAEAIYLCRILTELLPTAAEALGLLALMLHAESRRLARRDARGDYVPLARQDTGRWNLSMLHEAESTLSRAATCGLIGRYQLEAALQSAHANRLLTGVANWSEVLSLYDALYRLHPSPVVAVNRAVALAEVHGVTAALAALDDIASDARIAQYQPYWAARAELLAQTAVHHQEARQAYRIAAGLESDPAVRRFLQERLDALPEK